VSYLLILPRGYRANKVLVTRERLRGMNHVHHQLMHVRIMLMHLIHAYIESIVILASWCMHHWASIMAIALCHMHHFTRAWNTPSLCCTIIAIIHLNSASWSWLYIEHCTLSWSILSLSLDCIGINGHVLQLASCKSFR